MSNRANIYQVLLTTVIFAVIVSIPIVFASNDQTVNIYLFWTKGCPHCAKEKQYLSKLGSQDKNLNIITIELTESRDHWELFKKVGESLQVDVSGVPFMVVGKHYLIGWIDESTTGAAIEKAVQDARRTKAPDVVARLLPSKSISPHAPEKPAIPEKLPLPFFGEIEIKYLSLGMLTLMIGLLDGFNPCAMWVLVFLITLLLGMEDRRRMWILGGTFIFTSGLVYFLFMTAWLNFLVFVGFIVWVRIAIGLVAMLAGFYNLREYWTNRDGVCKLTSTERRRKKMERLKEIVQNKNFIIALSGLILLAFAVNLVELICSAGFPVIYLQILSLTPLPFWRYYLYIVSYIFLYMLDDMIVFVVAMITLQLIGVGTKYKHASNLIGGVLMLILGLLLIFRPEALMFG